MEGYELQIELAKKADQAAVTYALKRLKTTKAWQTADEDGRAEMKIDSYEKVVHKR